MTIRTTFFLKLLASLYRCAAGPRKSGATLKIAVVVSIPSSGKSQHPELQR
jgi:hypothetical protein